MNQYITVICTDGEISQTFICAKEILCQSVYFEKMLEPPWKESSDNIINILFDIDTFAKYIDFLSIRYFKQKYSLNIVHEQKKYTKKDFELYDYVCDTILLEDIAQYVQISTKNSIDNSRYLDLIEIPYIDLSILSDTEIIKLCKIDQSILIRIIDQNIRYFTLNNRNIITYIFRYSTAEIIKHIIDKYDDLCDTINKFEYIRQYPRPEIIKYIIDKCVDLECFDKNGCRPIHYICQYSTPEMIKYIIDKGVDLECVDNAGNRPIHYICKYSKPEMIKYIIDKGVDLECVDNTGNRPIHYICKRSTPAPEMIKYIIDKGVDLECANNNGWRPIHHICVNSTPEIIKYIIDKGVDLECTNNDGCRPIHILCKYRKCKTIIKYIIDKGINLDCLDSEGRLPIFYLRAYYDAEILQYYINKRGNNLSVQDIEIMIAKSCYYY